jgi:hypothetical protein
LLEVREILVEKNKGINYINLDEVRTLTLIGRLFAHDCHGNMLNEFSPPPPAPPCFFVERDRQQHCSPAPARTRRHNACRDADPLLILQSPPPPAPRCAHQALVDLKLSPEVLEVPVPKYFVESQASRAHSRK